jgi:hypothetical protein
MMARKVWEALRAIKVKKKTQRKSNKAEKL